MSKKEADMQQALLSRLQKIVGKKRVDDHPSLALEDAHNTIGVDRRVLGAVYPKSTLQVKRIIALAKEFSFQIHPISRGKNIGYGDKMPPGHDMLLLSLEEMNTIRSFDHDTGKVVIEPGVSQAQLHEFLEREDDGKWMMDCTGAGKNASVVGNYLEGGFGWGPYGNRRKHIEGVEAVFGDGSIHDPVIFPGIGPDTNSLFIQSSMGIVTAMTIQLSRSQDVVSYRISHPHDSGLESLVDTIRDLRQRDVANTLVHISDPLRTIVTVGGLPDGFENRRITREDASRVISKQFGDETYWNGFGGIYGSPSVIRAKKKEIVKKVKGSGGSVMFFSDEKLNLLTGISGALRFSPTMSRIHEGLKKYREVHDLLKGKPTDTAVRHIGWRNDEEDAGLLWVAPTTDAKGGCVRRIYSIIAKVQKEFEKKHRSMFFELPMTVTLVEPHKVVAVISLHFNKNNVREKEVYHSLYYTLVSRLAENNIYQYRSSILGLGDKLPVESESNKKMVSRLRKVLDPHCVIAPKYH